MLMSLLKFWRKIQKLPSGYRVPVKDIQKLTALRPNLDVCG